MFALKMHTLDTETIATKKMESDNEGMGKWSLYSD
jgi:hypothetical protein